MDKELLIKKWLNNSLSPEEMEVYKQSEDARFNEAIIKGAAKFKAPFNADLHSFEAFEAKKLTQISKKTKPTQWLSWVSGIAAIFIVAVGLYTWLFAGVSTIQTTIAQTKSIVLPDASEVLLSAASEISFKESSWEEERQLTLKGEAFFDVAKGSRFDVSTSEGTISVLGTEFNVKQHGELLEVTCYEGKVKVTAGAISEIITVGEKVTLRKGKVTQSTTTQKYPSWKDQISRFERAPIAEVAEELERYFEIKVNFEQVADTLQFSGAFEHNNLDTALQGITEPLNLSYSLQKNGEVVLVNAE